MPVLKNPRWERFAQGLASGRTADAAYQVAGYSENRGNATRLNAKESVLSRVEELQSRVAKRVEVTVESLVAEAELVRAAAMDMGQLSAAVSAIKEKGILAGVRVERSERKTTIDETSYSDSELDAAIAAEAAAGGEATPEDSRQLN